jgi:hypothetical protein
MEKVRLFLYPSLMDWRHTASQTEAFSADKYINHVISVLHFLMCNWMLISTVHPDSCWSWLHHSISPSFSLNPLLQPNARVTLFLRTRIMWIWKMFTSTNICLAQWVAFHIVHIIPKETLKICKYVCHIKEVCICVTLQIFFIKYQFFFPCLL